MECNARSRVMNCNKYQEMIYFTFKGFEAYQEICHCFTTKTGGVSQGYFSSLNLGFGKGDLEYNVIQNYKKVCGALDIGIDQLVLANQIHKTRLKKVTANDKGKGIEKQSDIVGIDGLYTNEKGIALVTHYADCVPLYFYDPVKSVIGLAHAGWRGTVAQIGPKMVKKLQEEYGTKPQNIRVGIGPSIGKCCFEVDGKVADFFKNYFDEKTKIIDKKENDKYNVDLWEANRLLLISVGVKSDNIYVSDLCTKCNKDLFFSHRGHNGKRGTLGAFLMLRDSNVAD